MKKFLKEYKQLRSKSDTSKEKWERVTVTSRRGGSPGFEESRSATAVGTIRTEEYKRDLAEFQARRSGGKHDFDTPVKRKCGRHSLPVSCTDCTADHDNTFNYEKKSGNKYKKKQKRARSASEDPENLPNIQFLFQNQVFMPGNMFAAYSEPNKTKRRQRQTREPTPEVEFFTQKRIDFNEDSSPLFYKNNSLPYDVSNFLDKNEVDGVVAAGDGGVGLQCSRSPSKEDSCSDKLNEVMSELKNLDQWADEQLKVQSLNSSKCDESTSDTSAYGLPIVTISDLDVNLDKQKPWSRGRWGSVPVQMRQLAGVSIAHVRRRLNTEVDILRKCRHPNIILLMGLYPDVHGDVHIICERCVDSLFNILHVQGRILSAQTAVQYNLDIANALAFLRMRGYIHTELTSHAVMLTNRDAAKLADFTPCVRVVEREEGRRTFDTFSAQPQYVNMGGPRQSSDTSPLLSTTSSDAYLLRNSVPVAHGTYRNSPRYRWHAPELFVPDGGCVRPCERSDVYSLTLLLWETCNASIPWKSQTYQQLLELYTVWSTGLPLPSDGTYPGCLLGWLRAGLALRRADRPGLDDALEAIRTVKQKLDELDYIIISSRVAKKQSVFSTTAWDSPDSDQSPVKADIEHTAEIHKHTTDIKLHTADAYQHTAVLNKRESETDDEFSMSEECSPVYESIKERRKTMFAESCFVSDSDDRPPALNYEKIEGYSSACSTPISKVKSRIRDIGTPGTLHRSDSTEYCSILSPDRRHVPNDLSNDTERPNTKLSCSFTPKSYKPLHIKVPDLNLDSLKALPKEQSCNRSSYNFRIKNYSLPSTPIARSNKLRKNAWLSGELMEGGSGGGAHARLPAETKEVQSAPETPAVSASIEEAASPILCAEKGGKEERTIQSVDSTRDSYTGLRRTSQDLNPEHQDSRSWSFKSSAGTIPKRRDSEPTPNKSRPDADLSPTALPHKPRLSEGDQTSLAGASRRRDELSSLAQTYKSRLTEDQPATRPMDEDLAAVLVKPLVQIHEKWIMEANRKAGRSVSLPTDSRYHIPAALKPASHCVDTLQKSLPQLTIKRPMTKFCKNSNSLSPTASARNGWQSEQYCQARDNIAKSINFPSRETDRCENRTWKKESDKCINTMPVEIPEVHSKMDQATDTRSIEEFIKDLIRKEFHHLIREMSDDASVETQSEELVNKGTANVLDALKAGTDDTRKETVKTFSRVKINGNNKPLLQITFSRSGENSLQVLDNTVNVTFCAEGRERDRERDKERDKLSQSLEETLTDECHVHSLKRCQAYNAIQEARSTEDLYIDDDLSAQMQENFGGKVKLIPLHGSLHEILCEREDDCCLLKVKQENGCDTIYFRCDNSDTESRDAIDGAHEDTVVYKRSISLVEERIQRVIQKDKPILARRRLKDPLRSRPKSDIIFKQITKESRVLSNSSPSLTTQRNDEVEVNIENVMSYDSSSDECINRFDNDDFERLEKEIENDIGNKCECLMSEETLSVINEESERELCSDTDCKVGI